MLSHVTSRAHFAILPMLSRHRHSLCPIGRQRQQQEASGSSLRRISTTMRSDKHLMRLPMDHFKRLLEEAYPNHAYSVRHKLKDCGMMRRFMTSGSLTWGAKLNEELNGSDTMPFPKENAIIKVYGGHPPLGRRRMSSPSPRPQLIAVGDTGAQGCNGTSFPSS
jgi:hypothetical protein